MNNPKHIRGLENVPEACKGGVLTIGNFDGVHRGHREIINLGKHLAKKVGGPMVAMTFELPPDLVIRPTDAPLRLSPHSEKVALLLNAGCDYVVTARTTKKLLATSPDDFIKKIIVDKFHPRHMIEGHNFFFGHYRAGNVQTLEAAGETFGYETHIVDQVTVKLAEGETRVSSTLIRQLVEEGRVEDADNLLSRPFTLIGPVVGGEQIGRVLNYPTANVETIDQVVPCNGVYAGMATIENKKYAAAISIGNKPTLGDSNPRTIEANLLDAEGDFYGHLIRLEFIAHLRDQAKFDSLDELKKQIEDDVATTRRVVTL